MKALFSLAERLAGPFLRMSLGLVLLWIGCIHLITPQPVVKLLSLSLPFLAESAFVYVLGALEVMAGILLIVDHFRDCSRGDRLALAHPDGTVLAEGPGSGFRCHRGDGKGCGHPRGETGSASPAF